MPVTRGEILDQLVRLTSENLDNRRALIRDPEAFVSKVLEIELPDEITLKVIEDTADSVHIVLPYRGTPGEELSDADLEAVAGGYTVIKGGGA